MPQSQKNMLNDFQKCRIVRSSDVRIIILGAGLAGLSAAYHLKENSEIYEKGAKVGGVASSGEANGFIFDCGIHVLHTEDQYVLDLLGKLLRENLNVQNRKAWIYMHGTYIKYPFQANTYGLPTPVVKECVLEFIKRKYEQKIKNPINYAEWVYATFGKGIADHFMIPYSKKMWTMNPKHLTLEWVNRRVPQPTLEEVLEGALGLQKKEFGPNVKFRYPLYKGVQAIPDALASKVKNINLNKEAVKIDLKRKRIYFKDGEEVYYDKVISTIPLPELVRIFEPVPTNVRNAAESLKYTSDFCVNFGIGTPDLSDKHWIYVPERRFPFLRIYFPHNLSPNTVPKGKSAISAEVFYSRSKGINKTILVQDIVRSFIEIGLIKNVEDIDLIDTRDIKYAYVIYTRDRKKNVKFIHNFLKRNDVYPAGRFGDWQYHWMDDAILSGKKVAEVVKDEI